MPAAFLVNVTKESDNYGKRVPLTFEFKKVKETMGRENLLAALPVLGLSLDPDTTYAFILTDKVKAEDGSDLGASKMIETLKWSWKNSVDFEGAPDDIKKIAEVSGTV